MFVIVQVIVAFSNQLCLGHHVFYDMPIRWFIIIVFLQQVIVLNKFSFDIVSSNKLLLQYSNYCIFQNAKQNKIKHEKKDNYFFRWTTFSRRRKFYKILLKNGYFSRDSKSLFLNMKTSASICAKKQTLTVTLTWHDLFVSSVRFGNSH